MNHLRAVPGADPRAPLPPRPGSATTVRVEAPGKINLFLSVGAPGPDGYHPLTTVFQAVRLIETVTARSQSRLERGRITLRLEEADARVPADGANLAVRAARLLAEATGVDEGVDLIVRKRVPVAGGMAGGSADAAATLTTARLHDDYSGVIRTTTATPARPDADPAGTALTLAAGLLPHLARGGRVEAEDALMSLTLLAVPESLRLRVLGDELEYLGLSGQWERGLALMRHSGPADLRIQDGAVVHWANFTAGATDLKGGTIYGIPWDQARVSADNPVEHVESYRGKRIFLVSGTESDRYESVVLPSQQSFEKALDGAGIGYEHYEDTGAHIVRWGRIQQDIDSMLNFLTKAG